MPRIPVSVRFDMFKKRMANRPEPTTPEEKDRYSDEAGGESAWGWTIREMSMVELARHVTTGKAISVALFHNGHRAGKDRIGGWVLGLDFEISKTAKARGLTSSDGIPVEILVANEFMRPFIGVAAPTSSDAPDDPRARVLIPLSRSVTPSEYRDIALVFINNFSDYLGISESKDASRYYYGSTPDPDRVYVNDDAVLDVDSFIAEHPLLESSPESPRTRREKADNYKNTPEGDERLASHFSQPLEKRIGLVKETLDWVLKAHDPKSWSREDWLQVAFAAWHGSDGSSEIRDYIVLHPYAPVWKNGADDFMNGWDVHEHQEGGITFASLQWLARQSGWLSNSGLEIPEQLVTKFNEKFVQTWIEKLEKLSRITLLQSQTGSGKTFALKYLWERLGKPKTVVFVPSIKLATELASTLKLLHGIPTTLYINAKTGRRLDTQALHDAQFLITTLQTFSTKVTLKGYSMAKYGLVYIEESDQLVQQFSRGGGGIYSSHVSDREARAGFQCLRDAFQNAGNVWCVDATMTQVTYKVADELKGDNKLRIYRNEWVSKKSPVHMLPSRDAAYNQVLRGLYHNKSVVAICDTASAASDLVETMKALKALKNKKVILITRETERHPDVVEFMSDVNKFAPQYDFIAYNSVMASGVSITNHKPDVTVQIGNYLTPRVNLQLLNRFRQQHEVYCFYQTNENLYADTETSLLTAFGEAAELEAKLADMPLVVRTDDAQLRASIAAITQADIAAQNRSTRDFYIGLLKSDGREVVDADNEPVPSVIKATLKQVREIKKERREYIAAHWNTVDPIDRDRPPGAELDALEVALGETHAEIEFYLKNIPSDVLPQELYALVQNFKAHVNLLNAFVYQQVAVSEAEKYLSDDGRAITTIDNNITKVEMLALLRHLYADIHEVLDMEKLERRSDFFLRELEKVKKNYDLMIWRKEEKYEEVLNRNLDKPKLALAFAKILLSRIGLKQRSKRIARDVYNYTIENADDLVRFMGLRSPADPPRIVFNAAGIEAALAENIQVKREAALLTPEQQARVFELIRTEVYTDFATAVHSVYCGLDKAW